MIRNSRMLLVAAIASVFAGACTSEPENDNVVVQEPTIDTVETGKTQVYYQIPTPNEFFVVIKEIGGASRPELMNPASNSEKYFDVRYKALNFGVYSADLAYASSYEIGKSALEYFKVVRQMGDELDISAAFDESVFNRIEENLENGDSLVTISNESYFDAYNYLEENDRGNVLALVVAGGWIESMYIVLNLAGNYKENNQLIHRIAQQKLTLENVIGFMKTYENDPMVGTTIADLDQILMIFETLDVIESDISTETQGDKLMFSGNAEFKFSKENYTDLTNKVKEIRNNIVNAKNS
jgi:hypothetical protein